MNEDNKEYSEIQKIIRKELESDRAEVRQKFIKKFKDSTTDFIDAMSTASLKWIGLDSGINGSIEKAHVSSIIYNLINTHVISMKLFLSGYSIPAGNLQRQVVESMALALLCSKRDLNALRKYTDNKYSSKNSIMHLKKHRKILNLDEKFVTVLEQAQRFYHNFSHPSQFSFATLISYSEEGMVYFGASFDEGKLEQYAKEIKWRVNLAHGINDLIDSINLNLATW